MSFVSREDFARHRRPYKDVPMPELGEGKIVRVNALSARDRLEYLASFIKEDKTVDADGARARLLAFACTDDAGARIFTLEDVAMLEASDSTLIERLVEAADELCGFSSTAEEIRSFFARRQNGSSPTDSPTTSDTPQ